MSEMSDEQVRAALAEVARRKDAPDDLVETWHHLYSYIGERDLRLLLRLVAALHVEREKMREEVHKVRVDLVSAVDRLRREDGYSFGSILERLRAVVEE